jgi:transposase-like protein
MIRCPECGIKMIFVNVPNPEEGDSTYYCKECRIAQRTFYLDDEALKVFNEFAEVE